MNESNIVQSLAAPAQEVRLQAFRALLVAGHDGLTPGSLDRQTGASTSALSVHLKELARAGSITQERQGRYLIYRASFATMNEPLAYLTENCCRGVARSTSETLFPSCSKELQ